MKYKNKDVSNKNELIFSYSKKEFKSPFRSTIPLIELVFENSDILKEFIDYDNSYILVFEDETKALDGTGPASCTDLRIYNSEKNYCIEAKRTEPKYETVKKYISKDKRHESVVNGWLGLINKKCRTKLSIDNIWDCTYQMIHRFASACKVDGYTEMLYFCFDLCDRKQKYYETELTKIKNISNNKVPIRLILFKTESTEQFRAIEKQWTDNKQRELSSEIIGAMAIKVMNIQLDKIFNI